MTVGRVGLPKELLESGLRRWGPLGDKDELQVVDDPVHYALIFRRMSDFMPRHINR